MDYLRIDQVCDVNPPKDISRFKGMDISFIPMEAVSTTGEIDRSRTISGDGIKNYTVFQDRDVLFAKITPCMENGKGGIVDELMNGYGAGSTEFIVIRPDKKKVISEWIQLFLSQSSYRIECKNHMTGSAGQKRVPPKYIAGTIIPVPSLNEQRRIVSHIEEMFSELDNSVKTLNATKNQLIGYRRAVVKYELQREHSGIQWRKCTIGDVCDCLDSKRKPVNKTERASAKGLYPYYGANGETGRIDDYIFDEELVLICEDETFVGRIAPFSYIINGKSWVNNHAHILRGKDGIIRNKYLNYILSYYPFFPLVTGTTGRKKLTQAALLKAPITMCDYATQKQVISEIESRLSACDSIEQIVDTALQQAEAMRQSILKQAFEGRL